MTKNTTFYLGRYLGRAAAAFLLLGLLMTGITVTPAKAIESDAIENEATENAAIEALAAELARLKAEYEGKIGDLERRLDALRRPDVDSEAVSEASDEASEAEQLASLREAARAAAKVSEPADGPEPADAAGPAVGRERNLNLLNPEISFTGILLGASASEGREEFNFQEFELDLQSALDPFSRTRMTLAVREEGVELEEAYINYSSLPGGLDFLAGKIRQRFGPLNRQHLHALPQSDYPLVYQTFFGEEGLGQTGLSFTWLLPKPWATANEITLEVTDGENEEAFGGEAFEDFSFLARVKNFWEVSDASYFEWGLSGISGKTAADGDSRVYGTDFTWSWQPPGRSKYRGVTWRAELLQSERDDELGLSREALGGYTYLEGLMRRNLFGGIRYDRAEDPLDPDSYTTGFVPYLTWWQSEYVRLRGELGFVEHEPSGESEERFTLQLTWAAGPHKHESY